MTARTIALATLGLLLAGCMQRYRAYHPPSVKDRHTVAAYPCIGLCTTATR